MAQSFLSTKGQSLVELLLAIALAAVILPALLAGMISSREGKAQQKQHIDAIAMLSEAKDAARSVRERGWANINQNGTFHPLVSGSQWTLASGSEIINGYTRWITIGDTYRDSSGKIASGSGTSLDPSTKAITISVSWSKPFISTISSQLYLTRYLDNVSCLDTTQTDFNKGILTNTQVTNNSGGEVGLGNNTKAKWCSPSFSTSTIDLPDGPPVAVAATSSAVSNSIPNDVFVAVAPYATSSVKLAYVNVTANQDPPVSTIRGTFTLDSTKYSSPAYVPTGINLTNSFKTNDVKYYKSSTNKTYVLLATDLPDHEVIAILVDDNNPANDNNTTGEFADPVNKIYKYKTFFNTRIYQGNNGSTPNQDTAPYGYGATGLTVSGNRGYAIAGGYLYTFDLSNIDSKTTSTGLDMVGCRIELDGYDCQPNAGTGAIAKYGAGQTGASWSDTGTPPHNTCSDGGNIEIYADNDIYPVQVGASTYIFVAVGAATNPEFNIANVTSVPTAGTSPTISNSSCGRISGGNAAWKRVGSLDFNSATNTEEAANSVYAKSDGTRAYISSNGGIDGDGNGQGDSKQFYVINTTNKSSPAFLSGTPATGATSGFYYGSAPQGELYPRRSLTVLNGDRVVLVGKDGVANGNDAYEYQVLNSSNEASPTYCGGVNFNQGFNDLTSVIEADFDTFVYMVANTTVNELKIIQGGPDGTYADQGTFESGACSSSYTTAYNNFTSTIAQPANTTAKLQVAVEPAVAGSCVGATYSYVGPDGTASTYFTPVASSISGSIPFGTFGSYQNPGQCFRYKLFLNTTDYNTSPYLNDVTTNYSP